MAVDKEAILKAMGFTWDSDPGRYQLCTELIFPAMDTYASSLLKENEELKEDLKYATKATSIALETGSDLLAEARNQLQSTNEAKDKELDYWKQRCEAAEEILSGIGVTESFKFTNNEDVVNLAGFQEKITSWQQLKQLKP